MQHFPTNSLLTGYVLLQHALSYLLSRKYVLQQSDGFHHFGTPSWITTLCLLGAWIIVALCIHRDFKLTGRVSL